MIYFYWGLTLILCSHCLYREHIAEIGMHDWLLAYFWIQRKSGCILCIKPTKLRGPILYENRTRHIANVTIFLVIGALLIRIQNKLILYCKLSSMSRDVLCTCPMRFIGDSIFAYLNVALGSRDQLDQSDCRWGSTVCSKQAYSAKFNRISMLNVNCEWFHYQ